MKRRRSLAPMNIWDIKKRLVNFSYSTNTLKDNPKIQEFIVFVSTIKGLVNEYKLYYPKSAKIVLTPEQAQIRFEQLFIAYLRKGESPWDFLEKWSDEEIFSVASFIADKLGDFSRWFYIACTTCQGKRKVVYEGSDTETVCQTCNGTGLMSQSIYAKPIEARNQ